MSTAFDADTCQGCGEPGDECVCWEEEDPFDGRLLDAFARHHPPLDLLGLDTFSEVVDRGCLVEVIGPGGRVSLRVYLDDASGTTYAVPHFVQCENCADDVADWLADPDTAADLTPWPQPHRAATSPAGGSS